MRLTYVWKHPDGTDCPEFSYPPTLSCPLVGTGVHKDATFVPHAAMTDEDVLDHFIGPIDVEHLVLRGEVRRILNQSRHNLTFGPPGNAKEA